MSRQQKRANERKNSKTAFQKLCLAAGEGVGKAMAFSFALASHAGAAEPKKEEPITLPPVVVQDQNSPYVVPQSSLSKFPEPLINTPQSITIVPQKLVEEQAGTTLRDALRNVPGITAVAGEGGGAQGDVFTLRGFNARNDMYIDGVRDSGSYFRDSFNFESVEVLKGPSSTYFGRGSTGGIINQVSKVPRLDPSYNGIFSAGGNVFLRGTIDVNQPIPQVLPNAAFRINLMAHRDDVVERDKIEIKRLGFAPSIAFGLGTPTQFTLSYLLQTEDNIPDYGFPYVNGRPLRTDRTSFFGLTNEDKEETTVNIGTFRLDHRFNDMFSFRNTLRYSHVDRDSAVTNATAILPNTLNRSRPQRNTQESILGNQSDLTAKFDTFGFNHTATTGLEVARETFDVYTLGQHRPQHDDHQSQQQSVAEPENPGCRFRHERIRFRHLCRGPDQVRPVFRSRRRRPLGLLRQPTSRITSLTTSANKSTRCGVIEAVWSFTRRHRKVIIFPTAHRSILPPKALPSAQPPTALHRKKTRSSKSAPNWSSSAAPLVSRPRYFASTKPMPARRIRLIRRCPT